MQQQSLNDFARLLRQRPGGPDPAGPPAPSTPAVTVAAKPPVGLAAWLGLADPGDKRLSNFQPDEKEHVRRTVGRITGSISLLLLLVALLTFLLQRPVLMIPFGGSLLIEFAVLMFPQAWPLAILHCLVLAAVFMGLTVAVTNAHVHIPIDPRSESTYMTRRTARFAVPHVLGALLSLGLGIALQVHGWRVVAGLVEGAAMTSVLRAATVLFVPVLRPFVAIELDLVHDGLTNRITIGHGKAWRRGSTVIFHDELDWVESRAGWLEGLFGLRSLGLGWTPKGHPPQAIWARHLAAADAVSLVEQFVKGDFLSARGRAAITTGNQLRQVNDPQRRRPQR